jgi:hypothetical protein
MCDVFTQTKCHQILTKLRVETAVVLAAAAVVGTETGAGLGLGLGLAAAAAVGSDPHQCEDTPLGQESPIRDWSCSHQS